MNTLVAKNKDGPATVINLTPMDMLERAVSSNAGVEVISKLMDLQGHSPGIGKENLAWSVDKLVLRSPRSRRRLY